jgi:homoserine kinase
MLLNSHPRPARNRPMTAVTVRVPATTANLGPGFDCLGLALDLENQVTISTGHTNLHIEVAGEGAVSLPHDEQNMVYQAVQAVYHSAGLSSPRGLHIRCKNRIPTGSGLGSSAAATLAGLLGANALLGNPLDVLEILRLGTDLEGHPDNIAAALFGGLVLVATPQTGKQGVVDELILVRRVNIPPVEVAVVVPAVDLSTQEARQALPKQILLTDAVYNIGRAIMVVEALRSSDMELLGRVMVDRLHQPHRLQLIPGAAVALEKAQQAGAAAATLSGAGPGLVAFCKGTTNPQLVINAMITAFQDEGIAARGWTLHVSTTGYKLRGIFA